MWPLSSVFKAPSASPAISTGPKVHLIVVPHLTKSSSTSVVAVANSLLNSPSIKKKSLLPPPTSVTTQLLVQLLYLCSALTSCGLPAAPTLPDTNPSHLKFSRLVKNSAALSLKSTVLGLCSSRQVGSASSVVQRAVLSVVGGFVKGAPTLSRMYSASNGVVVIVKNASSGHEPLSFSVGISVI